MTEEDFRKALARIAELESQVESLRREVASAGDAETGDADADDFGGGEPSWEGVMGRVPDGMVENPAIPPIPDTTAAKDPNALQHKSIDDRKDSPPPGVTQIHDFDETPLSNTRRIQIVTVAGTGTNPTKLRLVDPDGNADFRTKWMIPVREAGTGGREIKWVCIGGEVGLPQGEEGCAPQVTLTPLSGTTAHPNGGVRITVTPCEGTATSQDVWNGDDGAPGATGPSGPAGADGRGVYSVVVEYAATSTTALPPSRWYESPSAAGFSASFPYLWTHWRLVYDDGTTSNWVGPLLIGTYSTAKDGCSPVVTAASAPAVHGDAACTIQGMTPGASGCEASGAPVTVYNGKNGCTFTPHISSDGVLSWTNDCSATNPDPLKLTVGLSDQQQFISSIDYLRVDLTDNALKLGYTVAQWSAANNAWTYGSAEKAISVTVC